MSWTLGKAEKEDSNRINELFIEMLQTIYNTDQVNGYSDGDLDRFFDGRDEWISIAIYDDKIIAFLSIEVHHEDEEYIYFYAQTAKAITPMTDNNWMTLFINTGKNAANNWYGYDYAVNLEKPLNNSTAVLSKNVSSDEADNGAAKEDRWLWEKAGEALMKVDADKLMLAVKLSDIGIVEGDLIDIQFKWADNYQMDENGKYSINTFYIDGDSAPYGRLNYLYSEKA